MRCWAAAILGLGTLLASPAGAASPPTIGGFAVSDELHTRTRAKSLMNLIHRTAPTFTWAGSDMLWVEKDATGKAQFAMNHAYPIDSDSGAASWALFDAPPQYEARGFVDYTRTVTGGEVLSKSAGSQLYLVKWPSRQITGTGPVSVTRNLFVLNAGGTWKFVGEGPMSIDAKSDNKQVTTMSTFRVEWTGGEARPVIIRATRQATIGLLNSDSPQQFQWNRDMTLSGNLPAVFQSDGKDYTLAAPRETSGEMIKRLAMCDTYYPNESDPIRKSKMLRAATLAIAELNPHLPARLKAGAKVLLPEMENLWDYALRMAKNKPMHEQ